LATAFSAFSVLGVRMISVGAITVLHAHQRDDFVKPLLGSSFDGRS
jgi:hypothetical protein